MSGNASNTVTLDGIKIPADQSGIEITIRKMAGRARSALANSSVKLLSVWKTAGASVGGVVRYFQDKFAYRHNGIGQDHAVNPVDVLRRGWGDCNELNFTLGCVLTAAGLTVRHVTGDSASSSDGIDDHYWIVFEQSGRWIPVDLVQFYVKGRSPFDVQLKRWNIIRQWDFLSGEQIMDTGLGRLFAVKRANPVRRNNVMRRIAAKKASRRGLRGLGAEAESSSAFNWGSFATGAVQGITSAFAAKTEADTAKELAQLQVESDRLKAAAAAAANQSASASSSLPAWLLPVAGAAVVALVLLRKK